jgi:plastocyanin
VSEVPVGTTVVVTNTDSTQHTWTALDGTFDSGALGEGDTFEFTFTEAGTFDYRCNFHPSMTGTIVVTG